MLKKMGNHPMLSQNQNCRDKLNFKDLLRYPLDKEGVTAPGRPACLAHAMERGLLSGPSALLRPGKLERENTLTIILYIFNKMSS